MRTGPRHQLMLLLMLLLIGSSAGFFFDPRKVLMNIFQSLKAKKQPPKTNIQHYHVHYYPIPVPLFAWTKAPDKHDLDKLHDETIRSLGWSGTHYKYIPEPTIIISSGLQQLWDDAEPWNHEILESDGVIDDAHDRIDRNNEGIIMQVPVSQQFMFNLLRKSYKRTT